MMVISEASTTAATAPDWNMRELEPPKQTYTAVRFPTHVPPPSVYTAYQLSSEATGIHAPCILMRPAAASSCCNQMWHTDVTFNNQRLKIPTLQKPKVSRLNISRSQYPQISKPQTLKPQISPNPKLGVWCECYVWFCFFVCVAFPSSPHTTNHDMWCT